jgi:hypothetical protein
MRRLKLEMVRLKSRKRRSTCNFTQDELFLVTDAMVEGSFAARRFLPLKENSWVFKQCCLLNDARKLRSLADPEDKTATQIYDIDFRILMSATVQNLVCNSRIPTPDENETHKDNLRLAARQKLLSTGKEAVQDKTDH